MCKPIGEGSGSFAKGCSWMALAGLVVLDFVDAPMGRRQRFVDAFMETSGPWFRVRAER